MPSNTVQAVCSRFMKNPHREQFMRDNNLTLAQAAVVYFRRHTASKLAYATHKDFYVLLYTREGLASTYTEELRQQYGAAYFEQGRLHWWEIPVSSRLVSRIRPETLDRYLKCCELENDHD